MTDAMAKTPPTEATEATAAPKAGPASFSVDAASAPMLQELMSGCGALIAGRRLFDQTDGWGDNHPAGAPVVVVTHRPPPEDAAARFPRTTFTGRVEEAIATAKEIAGDKVVTIASADIIQQALNLGLVDEVCMSQVPVLFGTGIHRSALREAAALSLRRPPLRRRQTRSGPCGKQSTGTPLASAAIVVPWPAWVTTALV